MRSFIAIDLPGRIKGEIEKIQNLLKNQGLNCRWKRRDNFHLTLKFLGEITNEQAELIKKELVLPVGDFSPFTLSITGLGAFPNTKNVRILWLGLEGELEVLNSLQSRLEKSLEELGFPREKRKEFTPHITIGQDFKTPFNWNKSNLDKFKFNFLVQVKEIVLMRSEQLNGKRVYTPEAVFPLSTK
ncbi:MAG TPA: RNA 2',3'-cyclic phosphodiesterase [Clostridia bacterium]|nr:RNA 2',3'-cyclic phosphodiesterase [Clostridia bacterium]